MVKITRVGRRSVSGFMLASLLMAGQVSALEPEHETRRLMLATEEAVSAESWGEAGEYLNRLQQLEGEKPANYFYFRGRVMLESDHYNEAQAALEKYVSLAGFFDIGYHFERIGVVLAFTARQTDVLFQRCLCLIVVIRFQHHAAAKIEIVRRFLSLQLLETVQVLTRFTPAL